MARKTTSGPRRGVTGAPACGGRTSRSRTAPVGRCERPRALALVAVAAREVEVALELALLARDLGPAQHQSVDVEEPAQVDVCEDARRRRVAGVLEAVELDRDERVDGGELVDDEHRSARAQHAVHLGQHELGPRHVVERPRRADEVEGSGRKRERGRVRLDVLDTGRRAQARLREELGDDVDADDPRDERRQCDRDRAGAGAHVERALAAVEGEQAPEPLARRRRTQLLVLGEQLRRLCEPLRNGV